MEGGKKELIAFVASNSHLYMHKYRQVTRTISLMYPSTSSSDKLPSVTSSMYRLRYSLGLEKSFLEYIMSIASHAFRFPMA